MSYRSDCLLDQTIAEKLRTAINQAENIFLPTMAHLAKRYGVSISTVLAAARILREEGLLEFGRGRRARIVRKAEKKTEPPLSPIDRCVSYLKKKISTGHIKSGESFEKTSVLAKELHTSRTTITETLRELENQGLAHKEGKAWIVGPPEKRICPGRSRLQPFIVCAVGHTRSWAALSGQSRTARFCFEFSTEGERYGVCFQPAYTDPEHARKMHIHRDLEGTIRSMQAEGKRCLGVLIAATESRTPAINKWIDKVTASGIKTVWFDRYDRGGISVSRGKPFRRCHFCESAAVNIVIAHLASLSHKTILYGAFCNDPQSWQTNRFRLLRKACESLGITIIHFSPQVERKIETAESAGLHGYIYDPVHLKADLQRTNATAVIAPNDLAAVKIYNGLCRIGVRIARDISLISFDNQPLLQISPVSSVDFGMGYLGYSAFHYLFGVLPVKSERNGDIAAKPHIVNRGSTGPAPRK